MAIEAHGAEEFESPEVRTRLVVFAALGVLLLIFASVGVLGAIYYREVPVQTLPAPEKFAQPRVETKEREERLRIEADQARRLAGYRWVDRKQGHVQIPIERAMQLLAREGMQAYAPLAPAQALSSPTAASPDASTGGASGSRAGDVATPDENSAANANGHKP